jgi:Ca-activated chloride channel homolog
MIANRRPTVVGRCLLAVGRWKSTRRHGRSWYPVNARLFAAISLIAAMAMGQSTLSETVSVGYVMIPFTAIGAKGKPLIDLRSGEVKLFVDGTPVRSDMFEKSQNAPVSFAILLDGSGSMGLAGKMDAARAAIGALLAHRQRGDDFALFVFAESEAREVVPFTDDASLITHALAAITPYGKTAFFDALATMPERSRLGRNPSRAIVLLSDGIDNASQLTRENLARMLQGVAVPIYPLGIRDPREQDVAKRSREELSDINLLEEVASLTGGKLYLGNEPQQIALAVSGIEKDLRAQYLIGFAPTGQGAIKYRRIALRLAGRVQTVRVRAGYLGTEPPALAASGDKTKRNERKRT